MFVWGWWVDFEARAISRFFQLGEDDSEEYQALFVATNFEGLDAGAHTGPRCVEAPPVDGRVHHISDDNAHAHGEGLV